VPIGPSTSRSADPAHNAPVTRRSTLLGQVPGAVLVGAGILALAPVALAHGGIVPDAPPTPASLVLGWTFDPTVWLPSIVALLLWRSGVARANRAHPGRPVDRRRTAAWIAGIAVILFALDSGIARYDTTLFSVHMVQHMLLTMVAPPLLLLAGPITLLLQASSPATRRRWVLPFLHARVIRLLAFPVVAWILFAAVMWGTHFSPLFDASLETPPLHYLEHALYLGSASLFWWPVIGPDPAPWRMPPAVRPLYVGLQMTQNTFLAVAIYAAPAALYHHYVTTIRSWGPTPLADQQLAGGIMWLGGDIAFLGEVMLLVFAWMRDEQRRAPAEDRRAATELVAIREREVRLAARLAVERGTGVPGAPGPGAAAGPGATVSAWVEPVPSPAGQPSGGTGASR
jgi:cytochrome c oxidase assembly factor CtaG